MTLPVFKRTPVCPKCSNDNIAFQYWTAATIDKKRDTQQGASCGYTATVHTQEHIHLSCGRCSYGKGEPWFMAAATSPRTIGFRLSSDSTGTIPE